MRFERMRIRWPSGFLAAVLLGVAVFAEDESNDSAAGGKALSAVSNPELHNAHVVTPKVLSGAQPEGEKGFQALRELGVKTIISVDGARPDVETAKKYGIRYVHLPITYSTVTPQQGKAIARAIDDLPGPVYVHCHHGKHRSAAAVAVACVYNGMLRPEQAESVLKTFGTGHNYTGLWKAAREAKPLDQRELKSLRVDYAETAKVPPLAEAMVLVDRHTDHLKLIQKAGWQTPADHPDLDPAHEALQLQQHLREIGRTQGANGRPDDFRRWLLDGEEGGRALREALVAKPVSRDLAEAAFKRVSKSCTDCHNSYRN